MCVTHVCDAYFVHAFLVLFMTKLEKSGGKNDDQCHKKKLIQSVDTNKIY